MRLRLLPLFAALAFMLASCSSTEPPRLEVSAYSERTVETGIPLKLNIECDNCSTEVYSWNRKSVKLEITRIIRGNEAKETLLKRLEGFKTDIVAEGGRLDFKCVYKGRGKTEGSVGLRLYIPKKTSNLALEQKSGRLVLLDDFEGDIDVDAENMDLEINRMEGRLNCRLGRGDIRVSSGTLENESSIHIANGNIRIKASFESSGSYDFNTGLGMLDLCMPGDTNAEFDTFGLLESGDFIAGDDPSVFRLESKMGKISISKF